MRRRFKTVGLGGTFDELHKGHKELITKAFEIGENVIIGVSSDEYVRKLSKSHFTSGYPQRVTELRRFLEQQGLIQRARMIPIDDPYGGVLLGEDPIEALVVSRETEPTAAMINEKRMKAGIKPLQIVVVEMVPSENHGVISTTRIRRGEIDQEGRLLHKKWEKPDKPVNKNRRDGVNHV
jgi:pantetheine-phosphate adenylyltransferase